MTRHEYFVKRMKELGVYDEDSDYGGMIGKSVERMSITFGLEGHSGMSATITNQLWNQLMREWDDGTAFKGKEE